ncbi:Putative phosphinothricin acetyltransferase YwnH [Lonepinella sp. MS14434]|uniref:GNAT family N-acetyltransferase n=1 Tax=Lonepinella sp. MS14434 TaxID=3003617 RepID=UPI0036DC00DC
MKIRKAQPQDLSAIVTIYNQAIPTRRITADLTPVTEQQRRPWFEQHLNNNTHPLWVMVENDAKSTVESAVQNEKVLGWCSFSPFYRRAAFDQTAELSLYLDQTARGKGYGSQALQFMQRQMAACGINTLMAYVIEENHVSRRLFEKHHFTQWGRYPNIANMGDSLQTFLMYGFQQLNQI